MGHSARNWRPSLVWAAIALLPTVASSQDPSICFGSTANGRLENGWKLPARGENFVSYSTLGRMLGRTYVHSTVYSILLEAYRALANSAPERIYVYGETGKKRGGEFSPHKTHRNGLSVDFMVPVLNTEQRSVPLPSHALNKWGYALEFDASGQLDELKIDFEGIAAHLSALHRAALEHGADIDRVIFDPELQPFLHETNHWPYLRDNIRFSSRRSWVRHDEHYHVDFKLECQPNAPAR